MTRLSKIAAGGRQQVAEASEQLDHHVQEKIAALAAKHFQMPVEKFRTEGLKTVADVKIPQGFHSLWKSIQVATGRWSKVDDGTWYTQIGWEYEHHNGSNGKTVADVWYDPKDSSVQVRDNARGGGAVKLGKV